MTRPEAAEPGREPDWVSEIRRRRDERDRHLAEAPGSPLPADERAAFDGLSYYDIDPDYRFQVPLDREDDPDRVTVGTSTDGVREYLECGTFTVEVHGETVTITAYKSDVDDGQLWVPFRDATSGEETYGAGRYLDLDPVHHRTDRGTWILDFNQAYNPTCAYDDRYECPLPPSDNWLDVSIEAGELAYEGQSSPGGRGGASGIVPTVWRLLHDWYAGAAWLVRRLRPGH